jgi:hypothetical protein
MFAICMPRIEVNWGVDIEEMDVYSTKFWFVAREISAEWLRKQQSCQPVVTITTLPDRTVTITRSYPPWRHLHVLNCAVCSFWMSVMLYSVAFTVRCSWHWRTRPENVYNTNLFDGLLVHVRTLSQLTLRSVQYKDDSRIVGNEDCFLGVDFPDFVSSLEILPIRVATRSNRPLKHWDLGFKSHSWHGCMPEFVLSCAGSGHASGWSPSKESYRLSTRFTI